MKTQTKQFILRPIKLSDAQNYLECHQDKDAQKNFMSVPKNLNEAKKEIKDALKKKNLLYAVEVDKKFAGFVNLELNKSPFYKHSAVVGLGIHPDFRNKGLGTRVLLMITKIGFKKYKLKRIVGMCRTYNKASAKILKKAGFKLEGVLHKNKFKNGKYLDDMVWAKLK